MGAEYYLTPALFGWEILYHYRGLLTIVKSAVRTIVYNIIQWVQLLRTIVDGW